MAFPENSKIIYLCGLFFCFSIACSQNTAQVDEVYTSELPQLSLDHQFTISDSEEIILQQITGIKSDSEGRIFLTDQRALQMHVFDPHGEYLTSIGRDGSGPGEFQSLTRIYIDQNDRVFVFDINEARNTVFAENNDNWEPKSIFTTEGQMYGIESADFDGNLILRQSLSRYPDPGAFWYEHELATGSLSSGVKDKNVLTFKEMGFLFSDDGFMQPIPFGRTTVLTTDPRGNIYLVWNEAFEMAKYNAKMEFIDSLRVEIPNQPISTEENSNAMDRVGNNFRSLAREHMPDSKPVINNMLVDKKENIWLQTFDSPEYLVLDREGTPLKSFDLDGELRLDHVDINRIYAMKIGDEGYQIHVFEYRL